MLVILSEAKEPAIGVNAFASHMRINEAKMIERSSDIPNLFARSLAPLGMTT